MDQLQETFDRGDIITGTATGFHDLDELLSGLQPSTLNIIGARPAMGKTSLGLGIATHVAQTDGAPVLVFSLEMGHAELTQRILSSEAEVDSQKLRTGRLVEADWTKIGRAINRLEVPLFLDDNPRVTVMEIRAKARRMKAARRAGADRHRLPPADERRRDRENRQLEVSEISRGLKILARELEVPIIALSQLSRNLETRGDKRPMLSDLRESGSLEQDADVVMFLYRDEVYNNESPDKALGRGDRRQAPLRADRDGPPRVPRPVHPVRQRRPQRVNRCRYRVNMASSAEVGEHPANSPPRTGLVHTWLVDVKRCGSHGSSPLVEGPRRHPLQGIGTQVNDSLQARRLLIRHPETIGGANSQAGRR